MSIDERDIQRQSYRWCVCVIAPLLISLVPFRLAIRNASLPGAGPDVITTFWTMAWFRETWNAAAWGGHSDWFNFPFGGSGAILSPITAAAWSILSGLFSEGVALTLTSIFLLWGTWGAVFWMSRQAGWSWLASSCAALTLFCGRYCIYTLGETGVVGVAALPMIIGMGIGLRIKDSGHWSLGLLLGVCMALQGLENPYLTPVLPLFSLVLLWRKENRRVQLLGLILGVLGILLVGFLHHGATAQDYESVIPNEFIQLFGYYFPVIERPWARSLFTDMVIPSRVLWTYGVMDSIHISGRDYLGLSVLLGAFVSLFIQPKKSLPWFALGALGVLLSIGSRFGDTLSLFGALNSVADRLVRPLSQPTRYLLLATIGMAGTIGVLVNRIEKYKPTWAWVVWGVIFLDASLLGGLSLRLPDTELPSASCAEGLEANQGGVLLWPWDGADDEDSNATLESRLFQVVHRRPGATIGTGSWPLVGNVFPGHFLRVLGWRKAMDGNGQLDIQQLSDWGYTNVILDHRALRTYVQRGQDEVFQNLDIRSSSKECTVYDLPKARLNSSSPEHPGSSINPVLFLDNER